MIDNLRDLSQTERRLLLLRIAQIVLWFVGYSLLLYIDYRLFIAILCLRYATEIGRFIER